MSDRLEEYLKSLASQPTQTPADPQLERQHANMLDKTATAFKQAQEKAGQLREQYADNPDALARVENTMATTAAGPEEPVRLQTMRWKDIKSRRLSDPNLQIANTSLIGDPSGIQLQDRETGQPIAQMDPTDEFSPSDVERGHNFMSYVSGNASPIQKLMAQGINKLSPEPVKLEKGEGLKALVEKGSISEGRKNPQEALDNANAASKWAALATLAPSGIDWLQVPLAKGGAALMKSLYGNDSRAGAALDKIAQENETQGWQAFNEARQLATPVEMPSDPEEQQRIGELAGEATGAPLGAFAQMASPTEAVSAIGRGVSALAKTKTAGAIGDAVRKSKLAESIAVNPITKLFSNTPQTVLLKSEAVDAAKAAQSAARNAGDIVEWEVDQAGRKALQPIADASGMSVDDLSTEALKYWHSPKARISAPAPVQQAIDALQPLHEQVARKVMAKAGMADAAYDPFHLYIGQAPYKSGSTTPTYLSRKEAEGLDIGTDSYVRPTVELPENTPGMASLKEGTFTPRENPDLGTVLQQRTAMLQDRGLKPGEVEDIVKDYATSFTSGLAKSAKRSARAFREPTKAAYQTIANNKDAISSAYPGSFQRAEDWAASKGIAEVTGSPTRNVIGNAQATEELANKMSKQLASDDMVIVRVGTPESADALRTVRDTTNKRIVTIPSSGDKTIDESLQGVVMPRHLATSIADTVEPVAASKAQGVAQYLEDLVGSSQWSAIVTRANPGFQARNLTNQAIIMAMDGYIPGRNQAVMDAVRKLSRGESVVFNGVTIKPQDVRSLLGVGKSTVDALAGKTRMPKGPTLMGPLRGAQEAAANKVIGAGGAANDAIESAYKKTVFGDLGPGISAEDANRMGFWLHSLEKGMSPAAAARNVNLTLIDFADKNAITRNAKLIAPFIQYQMGAIKSVGSQIAKNPRAFSRAYDFQRALEYYDARDKGSYNTKLKTAADQLGGSVYLGDQDGTQYVVRPETRGPELGSIVGNIANAADSLGVENRFASGESGLAGVTGPYIGSAREIASGRAANTNRSILGLTEDEMDAVQSEFGDTNINSQIAFALQPDPDTGKPRRKDLLGDNARVTQMLLWGQQVPGFGRVLQYAPISFLSRWAAGLKSSPYSRTMASDDKNLSRMALKSLTGVRTSNVDPISRILQSTTQRNKLLPKSKAKITQKLYETGTITEDPEENNP